MKITINNNGKLVVPETPTLFYIEGDGIGRDICKPSLSVFDAVVEKTYNGNKKIEWQELTAGKKSLDDTGELLPNKTIDGIKELLVGIKGPLTTPVGEGFRSINVSLRQTLDLFVCLRPVRWFEGVPSPLKTPENVDITIFRENTEDIYAGIEFLTGTKENEKLKTFLTTELGVKNIPFPDSTSLAVKPISKQGTERIARAAIEYAITNDKPSVTIVHKGNIMKYTEGAFKNWAYLLAEQEFGDKVFTMNQYNAIKEQENFSLAQKAYEDAINNGKVIVKDVITDAFLQETLLRPQDYSVVVTMNLNGDYISDQIAAMVGGIGISPGANINYKTGHAIFEATHGTAPSIEGTGKANPSSFLLSGAMMFEYIGWTEASQTLHSSIKKTIASKTVTSDLHSMMEGAQLVNTDEFCKMIIENVN